MPLTTYAEYAEVRAALGVNDIELKDAVLTLPIYEMGVVRELNKVSTSLATAFSSIAAKSAETRTTAERKLYDAVRLFSVYAVAKQVGVSLTSFAPKDVSDGKASVSRFAGEPLENTLARVEAMYLDLRNSLVDEYQTFLGASSAVLSTVPTTVLVASGRSYDPVTG